MKIGILNITGYGGVELARLLANHPEAEIVSVTGRSLAGEHISDVFPQLDYMDITLEDELSGTVDVVFSALPQVASAEACMPLINQGVKVTDFSADFRLKDSQVYKQWYGENHPSPESLNNSVYGLSEINNIEIKNANLIANPGCYPTSALLGLAPLVFGDLVDTDIIIDSKSGVSGAGRTLSLGTHFSEVNESVNAYGLDGHRHLPEIVQEVNGFYQKNNLNQSSRITFVPHLIPMTRGILSTAYLNPKSGLLNSLEKDPDLISEIYKEFYTNSKFVKVAKRSPQTKQTLGNNDCIIYPTFDKYTGRVVVVSVIDNLVKGAAGQAIQNMNIMFDLPEDTGLQNIAMFP